MHWYVYLGCLRGLATRDAICVWWFNHVISSEQVDKENIKEDFILAIQFGISLLTLNGSYNYILRLSPQ